MIKTPVVQELCERVERLEDTLNALIAWFTEELEPEEARSLCSAIKDAEFPPLSETPPEG